MTCELAHLDGAYVLGSLAPAERADYERHLAGCEECSRSVRDLAGMPGLLGRVPPETLEQHERHEQPPATLLPGVLSAMGRSRRRRRTRAVAAAVAAAVLLITGTTVTVTAVVDRDRPAAVSTAAPERMESVSDAAAGWVSLTEVPWGTRIDLSCTYDTDGYGEWTYEIVVHTTDGGTEQVGTFTAVAGQETEVSAPTSAPPDEIASVVVRTTGGQPVLRLTQ